MIRKDGGRKGRVKVLQVSTHVNIGGIGNYILSLSKALESAGASVVVASSGGNLEREFEGCGIRHRRIDMLTKSELSPKVLKSIFALLSIIKEEKVDIIHAHTRVSQVAAFFASRITGVKYVTTCHGFFKKRMRKIFDTWGAKVIAISGAVRDHLEWDLGVKPGRIELIYSGVDTANFSKEYSPKEMADIKRSIGLEGGPVIGNIGRLSPVKGQRFLIEAMRQVISKAPDAQALIIGDGPEEARLRDLANGQGLGGSIHFVKSDINTADYLSIMDVFVFPSVKEGLGIALLEALAAGRACVASDIGGIGDIIENNVNGVLAAVGDSRAISEAIILLLDNMELSKKMGERGREVVRKKFALDLMAGNVMKLYEKVLKNR